MKRLAQYFSASFHYNFLKFIKKVKKKPILSKQPKIIAVKNIIEMHNSLIMRNRFVYHVKFGTKK